MLDGILSVTEESYKDPTLLLRVPGVSNGGKWGVEGDSEGSGKVKWSNKGKCMVFCGTEDSSSRRWVVVIGGTEDSDNSKWSMLGTNGDSENGISPGVGTTVGLVKGGISKIGVTKDSYNGKYSVLPLVESKAFG